MKIAGSGAGSVKLVDSMPVPLLDDNLVCLVGQEDYEFQHMVSGVCLLLVDSPALRLSLLTPWLRSRDYIT
jgi:hypothetical protein